MKYIKLLALLMLPFALGACSDDENYNSGEATVGFENAEISIKENTTMLNVPIKIEGDHTGLVKVNVVVKDCQGSNMELDKNVIMTSGELFLPADATSVNAEILLSVYTNEDHLNRSFTLEITSAQGATIGTSTCKVNIDEVVDPYAKLTGDWILTSNDGNADITIAENQDGTGYDCTMTYLGVTFPFHMSYKPTGLEFIAKETLVTLEFEGLGKADIQFILIDGENAYMQNVPATWNETYDTITLGAGLGGGVFQGGNFMGTWFVFENAVMTKK